MVDRGQHDPVLDGMSMRDQEIARLRAELSDQLEAVLLARDHYRKALEDVVAYSDRDPCPVCNAADIAERALKAAEA
jgi:hypothetical protein